MHPWGAGGGVAGSYLNASPFGHRHLPHTVLVVVVGLWVARGQDGPTTQAQHTSTRDWTERGGETSRRREGVGSKGESQRESQRECHIVTSQVTHRDRECAETRDLWRPSPTSKVFSLGTTNTTSHSDTALPTALLLTAPLVGLMISVHQLSMPLPRIKRGHRLL